MKKKIKLGAKVRAADGNAGVVERIVVDPDDHEPGYLVIRRGHFLPRRIVVPVGLVEEATPFEVRLKVDRKALDSFPDYEVTIQRGTYHRPVAVGSPRPFGIYYPRYSQDYSVVKQRNVPDTSVNVERGMPVLDASGMKVGVVYGLELESDERQATHLIVRLAESHGPEYRSVPVDLVADVRLDEVQLNLHARYVPALGVYRPEEVQPEGVDKGR